MNMWGWLKPLLEWLESLIRREAAKPDTLEDVKTPADIRRRWTDALRDKLRDKNSGH